MQDLMYLDWQNWSDHLSFQNSWVFALIPLLILLIWIRARKSRRGAFLYSSIQIVRGVTGVRKSRVGQFLMSLRWLAVFFLLFAWTGPEWSEGESRIKASGIDIVIALDLSGSMRAEDFYQDGLRVNRLVIAKETLNRFVQGRQSDRIGLVAFSGEAFIAGPLTLDHDFLLSNLNRLELGMIEEGTAIGSAIAMSVNRLRDQESKSKLVILITDGVHNAGEITPATAADAAKSLGVKVYTIGVGTKGEADYPQTNPFGQKVYVKVPVDIDEETLTEVAKKTGGFYFRADNLETLEGIYSRIDELEKTEIEMEQFEDRFALFPIFIVVGLTLLFLEIFLANTVLRRLP
jgi:Ca-activated chloride channel homolog